jgi:uncharacterized protein
MMRGLVPVVFGALLAGAMLLVLAWLLQRRLMYFPFQDVPAPAAIGLHDAEVVTFTTADALPLGGWFIRARPAPARGTVIVFNGNGGNRAYRAPLAAALQARGFNVLLFDYRGYGGNPGAPSESGLTLDARAARAYVAARPDVQPGRIVYFGESLGAAVAATLATGQPPAALVLRSPFTSMADMAALHYPYLPARRFLRDRFDTIDRIARVGAPVLVIAGDADRIVPVEYSRRLFEAAASPRTFVLIRGADHNDDALTAGRELVESVARFVDEALRLPQTS